MNGKAGWLVSGLLLVVIAGMAYKFLYQGAVGIGSDGRTSIYMSSDERHLVLGEMRGFLETVQAIVSGLNDGDFKKISTAARLAGMGAAGEVPGGLMGKLPIEFKQLGFDTHQRFDQLALDAEEFGDHEQTLGQLTVLMKNCIGCHAGYRIDLESN
ncbi:MAG: hypothetical protein GY934_12450 [Gammaproteobacteria bacterium]|nr:hypothetical protein [Gammaproteobacteria bacterium]